MKNEAWKPISGFEGCYEVSSLGRIRSLDKTVRHSRGGTAIKRGKIRKLFIAPDGYVLVGLVKPLGGTKTRPVHRLVAEAFLPNPSSLPEVNHLDGDRANPAATNLEWVTRKGNQEHASKRGSWRGVVNNPMGYNRYKVAPSTNGADA